MVQSKQIWKLLLIVAIIVACAAALVRVKPGLTWKQRLNLKPGLDLVGGTTLVYEVDVGDAPDPKAVIEQTIEILRARVDPTGVKNLIWRQAGENRIEIEIAQPPADVDQRRKDYLDARTALLAGNITQHRDELDEALRQSDPQRLEQELTRLAGGNMQRLDSFRELAQARRSVLTAKVPYDAAGEVYFEAQARFDKLTAAGAKTPPEKDRLEAARQALAAARHAYVQTTDAYRQVQSLVDAAEAGLARTDIAETELDRILAKPAEARQADIEALIRDHPAREPAIRGLMQAYARYEEVKGELDDPNDLVRMLRGSGVLEFRIAPQPDEVSNLEEYRDRLENKGPLAGADRPYRWIGVDDPESMVHGDSPEAIAAEAKKFVADLQAYFTAHHQPQIAQAYAGKVYVLLGNSPADSMTKSQVGWELTGVDKSRDDNGAPAVAFNLNPVGATLMGDLTGNHVGKPMAIVLDDRVISTPVIQQRIDTGGVRITGGSGGFSPREQDYLIRTLSAGSLQVQLSDPISIQRIGPQLGQDNLTAGLRAAIWAFVLVSLFMLCYYWFWGAVANFALIANLLIVLGIMAAAQATFTLPGIAGMVLTIGMAVDSNVLIYERIREELERKNPLKTAIRLGNQHALRTIIDAHVTALATCLILYLLATADIKGFAVTLGLGLLANLFTACICSRVIADTFVDLFNPGGLPMLPMKVGFVHRLLSPKIDWIGLRWYFWSVSGVLTIAGMIGIVVRGADFFDIEFRSGTQITFELATNRTPDPQSPGHFLETPVQLSSEEVGDLLDKAAALARLPELGANRVSIVTVGATETVAGKVKAHQFSISSLIHDPAEVARATKAIKTKFHDVLDKSLMQRISFQGAAPEGMDKAPSLATAPVYLLTSPSLETDLRRPVTDPAQAHKVPTEYLGGVAVLIDGVPGPGFVTTTEVKDRIDRARLQAGQLAAAARVYKVIGLTRPAGNPVNDQGEPLYQTLVVIAHDATTNADHPASFESGGLADTQWQLVHDALTRDSSLGSVTSFSSQVSGTMTRKALLAVISSWFVILAYIWFRFGNVRYGLGAVIAMIHDVITAVGLAALAKYACEGAWSPLGHGLLLQPFRVNLAFVASVLTLIGYSVNDTIVVFDRIRENRGKLAFANAQIINDSINQTISRTILTALTVFICVTLLYCLGGESIRGFAFVMLVGTLVGCYSSIAVAAPLLLIGVKLPATPGTSGGGGGTPAVRAPLAKPPAKPAAGPASIQPATR
jgi:SecD/SecF fusion protein